jgi:hypothetical protein
MSNLQNTHDKAWDNLKPQLNNCSTDILDFIYELPELGPLWELYFLKEGTYSLLRDVASVLGPSRPLASLKDVADRNLELKFGGIPFVSDVNNILDRFFHMKENMDAFVSGAGAFFRHHWSEDRVFSDSDWSVWADPSYYNIELISGVRWPTGLQMRVKRQTLLSYHATAIYKYTLPDLQGVWNTIAKYLTYWGVSFDASTIWNELPFSFVLDWFFNISKWLHSHRFDLYKVDIMLADFCASTKSTHTIATELSIDGVSYPGATYQYVEYNRNRAIPKTYYGMDTGKFSIDRLGIALSLIEQRI